MSYVIKNTSASSSSSSLRIYVAENENSPSSTENPSTLKETPFIPTPLQKLNNPPGAAMAERLRQSVTPVPGAKSALGRFLPGYRGEFFAKVKGEIRKNAIQHQIVKFAEGATSDLALQAELRDELNARVDQMETEGISERARTEGKQYIQRKYGGALSLQFTAGPEGGEFKTRGTSLSQPIIRSENGELFQSLSKIENKHQTSLLDQTGLVRHAGDSTELGEGQFGKVRIARRLVPGGNEFVAVKEFFKRDSGTRENAIVRQLPDGDHVSRLREPAAIPGGRAYLFMELAGYGDGFAVARRINRIKDPNTRATVERTFVKECVKAVKALHEGNPAVRHLDIKPDNFLVTKDARVLISDFGASRTDDKFGYQADGSPIVEGTAYYMDPHWIEKNITATDADKYSLGKTLYIFSIKDFNPSALKGRAGYDGRREHGTTLGSVARKLMDFEPKRRPGFDELLELPYFKGPTVSMEELAEYLKP